MPRASHQDRSTAHLAAAGVYAEYSEYYKNMAQYHRLIAEMYRLKATKEPRAPLVQLLEALNEKMIEIAGLRPVLTLAMVCERFGMAKNALSNYKHHQLWYIKKGKNGNKARPRKASPDGI